MIKKKSKGVPHLSVVTPTAAPAVEFVSEHPLFPVNDDVDPAALAQREIAYIYVFREGVSAPDPFRHNELMSPSDIAAKFGGGTYLLKARGANNARWTAQSQITLPGARLPMDGTRDAAPVGSTAPAAAFGAPHPPPYPYPYPPPPSGPSWVEGLAAIAAAAAPLLQLFISRSDAAMELRRAELAEQSQLMTALLTGQTQRHDALLTRLLDKNQSLSGDDVTKLIDKFRAEGAATTDTVVQGTISSLVDGLQAFADLQHAKAQQMAIQKGMAPPPHPGAAPAEGAAQ